MEMAEREKEKMKKERKREGGRGKTEASKLSLWLPDNQIIGKITLIEIVRLLPN